MKYNILFLFVFLSVIIYASVEFSTGMVGMTRLNGEGCVCHNLNAEPNVSVWIEGPDTVAIGDTATYYIFLSGLPAVKGGFNAASYFSFIDTADGTTKRIDNELTHSSSPSFGSTDTLSWAFIFIPADSVDYDTLYSVALSANGDGIPSEDDKWNFGENFLVTIIPKITQGRDNNTLPADFVLAQNYPNPFNPATTIKFSLPLQSQVKLSIYNSLGELVSDLIDGKLDAGYHEVLFNANGLASGVYYYRISANEYIDTKKMLLIK